MSEHETDAERVSLYALGCLDEDEAKLVSLHISQCAVCLQEYTELFTVASLVGYAAEHDAQEHTLRLNRVKRNLLKAVGGERPDTAKLARQTRPYLADRTSSMLALAAAFTLLFLTGAWNFHLQQVLQQKNAALEAASQTQRDTRRIAQRQDQEIALLLSQGAHLYPLMNGMLVRRSEQLSIVLERLPPLPRGKVYQTWTLATGATTMKPGITFLADPQNRALVVLPDGARQTQVVAVSVEPRGGSLQPTSKPLFVQQV